MKKVYFGVFALVMMLSTMAAQAQTCTVTVNIVGAGQIRAVWGFGSTVCGGGGASCAFGRTCGTAGELQTLAADGFYFVGWQGGPCDGESDHCSLVWNQNMTFSALFEREDFQLQVTKSGEGSGTVLGDGINCGDDCEDLYGAFARVELLAIADSNSRIESWSLPECGNASQCTVDVSNVETVIDVTFEFDDQANPEAGVLSPNGGEFWLLSSPEPQTVAWFAEDDIRICQAEARLLYSNDAGLTWQEAQAGGGFPFSSGDGPGCSDDVEVARSFEYQIPSEPPSGTSGSLYQVEVRVVDYAGKETTTRSEHPFYIVQPDNTSVKTLILWNRDRMQQEMPGGNNDDLALRLQELAGHPKVQGRVIDLGALDSLTPYYSIWDADPGHIGKANAVLFGEGAIHDQLLQLMEIYGGVRYLVLVGDDRLIPMARIPDTTELLLESTYISELNLSTASTVGQALHEDYYLSDDPLAVLGPLVADDLLVSNSHFLPELAVGRLVETHEEIITSVSTFLSQDGVLDLRALDPSIGHKVQITGYDFLTDSAKKIRERWRRALGAAPDDAAIAPVDGQLIGSDWDLGTTAERIAALRQHLAGNGGEHYGVLSLNGHANHFAEGVPGESAADIQGLSALEFFDVDSCGNPGTGDLDLAGSVIYSVGCHSGLSVPGSCSSDIDHSLDLPQTYLSQGASAYIANSGYGWGLLYGIGYGERLVEMFTEEMLRQPSVILGETFLQSKKRYYQETPRFDVYDQKTTQQWTFYGFPMYALVTGIEASPLTSIPNKVEEQGGGSTFEEYGDVIVERRVAEDPARFVEALPDYVTQLDLRFDFSAGGVYEKRNSLGDVEEGAGCSDPFGCYQTLNGLATGSSDLPIQPYFAYNSQLQGTSQHGVLWKGGTYREENGWRPLFGQLISNGPVAGSVGSGPLRIVQSSRGPKPSPTGGPGSCPASDDALNSLVVPTEEIVCAADCATDPEYSIQRLFEEVELEVFYFNNPMDTSENCDRLEPVFNDLGGTHTVLGATVHWDIEVADPGYDLDDPQKGIWRVVVVYTDDTEIDGVGFWTPLELQFDAGSGTWRGDLLVSNSDHLSYFLQAIDNRGNVAWLEVDAEPLPPSGIPLGLPQPIDVQIELGIADLELSAAAAPSQVLASGDFVYSVDVVNNAADPAALVEAQIALPAGVGYRTVDAPGWACEATTGDVTCSRDFLSAAAESRIDLFLTAPASGGTVVIPVEASALNDPEIFLAQASVLVVSENATDVAIEVDTEEAFVSPGQEFRWTISATNHGPNAVIGGTIEASMPAQLTAVTWSCSATPGSSCTIAGSGDLYDTEVDLQVDGWVVYTVDATVTPDAAGPIPLSASWTPPSGMVDFDPSNDTVNLNLGTASTNAVLAITALDKPSPVDTEAPISYEIQVTNTGPDPAYSAVVSSTFGPGALFRIAGGDGWTCTEEGGMVSCHRDILDVGVAPPIDMLVDAPAAAGDLEAFFVADAANASPNSIQVNTEVVGTPQVDLAITLDDGGFDVMAGKTLRYTVLINNYGSESVVGAEVQSTLAPALVQSAWTCTASAGAQCTTGGVGEIADTVDLAAGSAITYVITSTVPEDTVQPLTSLLTVLPPAEIEDSDLLNNTATSTTEVLPLNAVDLAVSFEAEPDPVAADEEIRALFEIFNHGSDSAYDVTATLLLPPGTLFQGATGSGWTCSAQADQVECSRDTLGSGLAPAITAILLAPSTGGSWSADGIVSASNDPNTANNSAVAELFVIDDTMTDLALTKQDGGAAIVVGRTITYEISVQNLGPNPAFGAQVQDILATELRNASWTCVATPGSRCTESGFGDLMDTVDVEVNGALFYTLHATVDLGAQGSVTNEATVTVAVGDTDLDSENNRGETTTEVLQPAGVDLELALTTNPEPVSANAPFSYTVQIMNHGTDSAQNVVVTSPLPEAVAYRLAGGEGWSCSENTGLVRCERALAGIGESPEIYILVDAPPSGGTLSLSATVTTDNDQNPGNDTATDERMVIDDTMTDVSVRLAVPESAVPDQALTWTVSVHNLGPHEVDGVVVEHDMAPEFQNPTWSCVATDGSACATEGGSGDILESLHLASGGWVVLTVTAWVAPDATGSIHSNASVTLPMDRTDLEESNNASSETIDIPAAGNVDLGIQVITEPAFVMAEDPFAASLEVTNLDLTIAAQSLRVDIALPAEAEYLLAGGLGWVCGENGSFLNCSRATLAAGATSAIEVLLDAPSVAPAENGGQLFLDAEVSAVSFDPAPENNTASAGVQVVDASMSDLQIVKEGTLGNSQAEYSIVVSNQGPNPVLDAMVIDHFPDSLVNVQWACVASVNSHCTEMGTGDIVDTVDIQPNGVLFYMATADVSDGAPDPIVNVAEVHMPGGSRDYIPENNTSTALISPQFLFKDGFESGDASAWTDSVGLVDGTP